MNNRLITFCVNVNKANNEVCANFPTTHGACLWHSLPASHVLCLGYTGGCDK